MANHYSDIGFRVQSVEDINGIIDRYYRGAALIPAAHGRYGRITVDGCIELWVQLDSTENELEGLELHYATDSAVPVRFCEWTLEEDMSGSMYVWYGDEMFPMILDVPNADLHRDLVKDQELQVQIACFAEYVECYPSSEAYYAAQADSEPQFNDEFFIPTGTFSATGDPGFRQSANAMFAGVIRLCERRRNSYSSLEYYYFTVECLGALFDVVADTDFFTQEPVVGGILKGGYWMSGRILG